MVEKAQDLPRIGGVGVLPHAVIKIDNFDEGKPDIVGSGTGFFYAFDTSIGLVPTIVTNKHVIDEFDTLTFHFALSKGDGKRILGPAKKVTWLKSNLFIARHPEHDVDLVCILINPLLEELTRNNYIASVATLNKDILPPEWLRERLIASSNILMAGFPDGLMDEANNLPIVRKGILATQYTADHNGKRNFVLDIAAFGGSSGSPVFAHFEGMTPQEEGFSLGGNTAYLIGVLHSGPLLSAIGDIHTVPIPTSKQISQTSLTMHLAYCLRSEIIEELLNEIESIIIMQSS